MDNLLGFFFLSKASKGFTNQTRHFGVLCLTMHGACTF